MDHSGVNVLVHGLLAVSLPICGVMAQFNSPDIPICDPCVFPLVADVDMNGSPDLIFTSAAQENIIWRANDGAGNFDAEQTLAINQRHLTIDLAEDADGDGDIDLIGVSLEDQMDSLVAILRNEDGFFVLDTVDYPMTADRSLDQLADLDGDGDLDLLSLNAGDEDIWYRNAGDGIYARERISHWCSAVGGPYVLLDAENDGDLDLVRYNAGLSRFLTIWNLGGAHFGPWSYATPPLQGLIYEPAAGKLDADGDGLTDLVFGGRVLYSNGNGTFIPVGNIWPMGFQSIANVNCEVAPEAVLSSAFNTNIYTRLLDQWGQLIPVSPAPPSPSRTALYDLNMDGRLDLLIGPAAGQGPVSWRDNNAIQVEVDLELPVDTITADTVLQLSGGTPLDGGYYTGPGVFNNLFYSSLAGVGTIVITYHYLSFTIPTLCGGTATDTLFIVDYTGLAEHKKAGVLLYPVPADERCCLGGLPWEPATIDVIDALGQRTKATLDPANGRGERCVRTEHLANGPHVLDLRGRDSEHVAVRFVVMHKEFR